jgi:uncharacterized protein involved in exopolysaccharide biosynthesis
MEEQADIRQYWAAVKRRKWQIIIPAVLVFVISVVIAMVLPPRYKSTGTILIEAQEIPESFVQSSVTGYVEERIQALTQVILSRGKLLEIINRFGLYEDLRDRYTTEEIIEKMRENIVMEPIQTEVVNPRSGRPGSATIAFMVSFEGESPRQVTQVANVLASAYLEQNMETREEQARGTFDFLENQQEQLRAEIVDSEAKIAAFKRAHVNELPELMELNLQTMDRLERRIDAKEEEIKTLVDRKIYLEGQLATVEPLMYTVTSEGRRVMTPKEELESLRSEYLKLKATMSPDHPDVIDLRKRLNAMESEVTGREKLRDLYRRLDEKESELAKAREKFSEVHPDVIMLGKEVQALREEVKVLSEKQTVLKAEDTKPENPSYINLQTQITSTEMDIRTTRAELAQLKEKYRDYQRRVENTPQVEQEYRALQRDYQNAQAKYQETTNRLLTAREAKGLEEKRMAEKFTLIDPPAFPEKPTSPNRLAIVLIGLVLAMGTGVGFGSLAEYMDESVRDPEELTRLAKQPVLAAIPFWETRRDRAKKMWKRVALGLSAVGIIAGALVAIHYFYRPLDVLWIQVLRRLSIG